MGNNCKPHLPWLGGLIAFCALGWFFADKAKNYLNIILLTICTLLVFYAYYSIHDLAFALGPGDFALGFILGHTSATFEKIIGLRFSNFFYKISFCLLILLIRVALFHHVPVYLQAYHASIIFISLIVTYQREKEDRILFQGFHDYGESLTKFKKLVSSGLFANLLILTRDLKQELFISDPLSDMAKTQAHIEEEISQETPLVLQWLDKLVVEKQALREIDRYRNLIQKNEANFSVLAVLREMKSRTSFIRSQNKLTLNAKVKTQDNTDKIFEIKVLATVWDDKDALSLILNDVTEHYLNISLQVADRNKDKMLAMISHELRTPLNGVLGVVNILKKEIRDPQQQRYLTVCHNSGELLLNLVNSILDLQQIRDKKFALKFTRDNLYELLGNIYDLFKFQFDQKGLYLKLEISHEVPEQIITDQNRLRQILINLIGNALKFTFKGGVSVYVDLDPVFDGNVHFRISDTGTGIKEEDMKKLFKMYGRLDQQETKTNTQVVGLGLEISNQLALLLAGGQEASGIKVESQVGEGTTFSFSVKDNFNGLNSEESYDIHYHEPRVFSEDIEDVGIKMTPYSHRDIFSNDRPSPVPIISGFISSSENLVPKSHMPSLSLFSSQKLSDHANSQSSPTKKPHRSYNTLHRSRGGSSSPKHHMSRKDDSFTDVSAFSPYHAERKNKSCARLQDANYKPKILLVDDNPFNLLVARRIVEKLGYTVETALNGELAIEEAKTCASSTDLQYYSAVLMDLQMPVMDGYEATIKLRKMMENKEIPEIPIIAVSANDTEDDKKRCKEVGMYKHLSKPLYEGSLRKVLNKALEKEAADTTFGEIDEAY